jgi:hypothetical protein
LEEEARSKRQDNVRAWAHDERLFEGQGSRDIIAGDGRGLSQELYDSWDDSIAGAQVYLSDHGGSSVTRARGLL